MNLATEATILDKNGISATPIGLLVLQTLLKNHQAFSLKKLEDKLFYSDRSTIFRTLQLFEKNRIIHEIINSDGIKNYALCSNCEKESHNDNHAHLKCKNCKAIFCIPMDVNNLFSLRHNFQIDNIQVFVNGICKVCNSVARF